jgi:hypothetical protein
VSSADGASVVEVEVGTIANKVEVDDITEGKHNTL